MNHLVKYQALYFFKMLSSENYRPDCILWIDSSLASGDFCLLLIIFANNLDPDHDSQNVGPDLDPNCLTLILIKKA